MREKLKERKNMQIIVRLCCAQQEICIIRDDGVQNKRLDYFFQITVFSQNKLTHNLETAHEGSDLCFL